MAHYHATTLHDRHRECFSLTRLLSVSCPGLTSAPPPILVRAHANPSAQVAAAGNLTRKVTEDHSHDEGQEE